MREFAERILFATSLEEKLRAPESISDEHPGGAITAPSMPGRPADLQFKTAGSSKGEVPSLEQLEKPVERARLLHFFANHELLATELMALVLLRFPDAPKAFRRGVLQTLKDEQAHTLLYIRRIQECGMVFGELPVSGYFWRAVSAMENPIDYVAGLSLTFEQANLDFAKDFAGRFSKIGDLKTAELLEQIHRDEIGHVAYGLKWFRRWKNPSQTDWEAFCTQLKFPLSPQRAKGFALNVDARRAAGLDAEFINELSVYSHSKGRTPNVFLFNPFAEGYIAQGKAFTPVKHQVQLGRDLANLPQFLGRQDDIVLVEERPSAKFLGELKEAGFALPEFVEIAGRRIDSASLLQRKLGGLRPWAWGPDSVEVLRPLFGNVGRESRTPEQTFDDNIGELYSKVWSAELLRSIVARWGAEPWLCTEFETGRRVTTLAESLRAIAAIREAGHHRVVVKQALGLAGQNALRLWEPEVSEAQKRWMAKAVANGRELVVEPWLSREADFSVQLEMSGDGLRLQGFTGLWNDERGQFQGNFVQPGYRRNIPREITQLLGHASYIPKIRALYDEMFSVIEQRLKAAGHFGPIGIDALVYRCVDGACRLKPIVEINPRYTMGRLALELMDQTCPGTYGMFRLLNRQEILRAGFVSFTDYAGALNRRFPVHLEGHPHARIKKGALCLNDPERAEVALAIFQVSGSATELNVNLQVAQ